MPDGSVLLVEIARGTLSRVRGGLQVVAQLGGGPNGAAIGPDGHCYVCNNGGFKWIEAGDRLFPGQEPENYAGGRIEKVDLTTGGEDLKTAYITLSSTGQLVSVPWERPGLPLNFLNGQVLVGAVSAAWPNLVRLRDRKLTLALHPETIFPSVPRRTLPLAISTDHDDRNRSTFAGVFGTR